MGASTYEEGATATRETSMPPVPAPTPLQHPRPPSQPPPSRRPGRASTPSPGARRITIHISLSVAKLRIIDRSTTVVTPCSTSPMLSSCVVTVVCASRICLNMLRLLRTRLVDLSCRLFHLSRRLSRSRRRAHHHQRSGSYPSPLFGST